MKERPILFSGPMVNAIREGRKTQTRRVVKPQPSGDIDNLGDGEHIIDLHSGRLSSESLIRCPYGQPGDRLWVKETFQWCTPCVALNYVADKQRNCKACDATLDGPKRPSLFMTRRCSRILLEITAIRVERLQDISEEDAVAEGCYPTKRAEGTLFAGGTHPIKGTPKVFPCAKAGYRDLWESINGPGSWEVNPWVWVIEFKVLEGGKR